MDDCSGWPGFCPPALWSCWSIALDKCDGNDPVPHWLTATWLVASTARVCRPMRNSKYSSVSSMRKYHKIYIYSTQCAYNNLDINLPSRLLPWWLLVLSLLYFITALLWYIDNTAIYATYWFIRFNHLMETLLIRISSFFFSMFQWFIDWFLGEAQPCHWHSVLSWLDVGQRVI